jgi:hypothetical protein
MWSQLSVTEEPDNARRPEISLDMGLFELYVLDIRRCVMCCMFPNICVVIGRRTISLGDVVKTWLINAISQLGDL